MNPAEMEALVRSVIVHHGLPFGAVSVVETPDGWNVLVRTEAGGDVAFAILASRPAAMRVAVQQRLEAAL
jgi:hypothetical protein